MVVHQRVCDLVGQLHEQRAHRQSELRARRDGALLGWLELARQQPAVRAPVAQPVQAQVRRRAIQPRRDRTAGELLGLVRERQKELVQRVLGLRCRAEHLPRPAQHEVAVLAVDAVERQRRVHHESGRTGIDERAAEVERELGGRRIHFRVARAGAADRG